MKGAKASLVGIAITAMLLITSCSAVEAGDEVIVETETGTFTYQAGPVQYVPYAEVINSELIWGNAPDRLVLVTCNFQEDSGAVVEAWLVSAVPRA